MTTPSKKAPAIESFIDKYTESVFGLSRTDAIKLDICVVCHDPIEGFRDPLSVKEYKISGMCQKCQDQVFGNQYWEKEVYDKDGSKV
jgi:hypothetical protein